MKILFNHELKNLFEQKKVYFNAKGDFDRVLGKHIILSDTFKAEPYSSFNNGFNLASIGSFSYFNSVVPSGDLNMVIGRYCSIAPGLGVLASNHPMDRFTTSSITYDNKFIICTKPMSETNSDFKLQAKPKNTNKGSIKIGNDVWIGAKATLARGISIGNGAVIAAGALVTKNVPPYAIVGGNPARIIKFRFNDDIILELLKTEWWKYKFSDFQIKSDMRIEEFIEYINANSDSLKPFSPEKLTFSDIIEINS